MKVLVQSWSGSNAGRSSSKKEISQLGGGLAGNCTQRQAQRCCHGKGLIRWHTRLRKLTRGRGSEVKHAPREKVRVGRRIGAPPDTPWIHGSTTRQGASGRGCAQQSRGNIWSSVRFVPLVTCCFGPGKTGTVSRKTNHLQTGGTEMVFFVLCSSGRVWFCHGQRLLAAMLCHGAGSISSITTTS